MKPQQLILDAGWFSRGADNGYAADLSDLRAAGVRSAPTNFILRAADRTHVMTLAGIDKDGSGEDTAGWRYTSTTGAKVLIIND